MEEQEAPYPVTLFTRFIDSHGDIDILELVWAAFFAFLIVSSLVFNFAGLYLYWQEKESVTAQCPHSILDRFVMVFFFCMWFNLMVCKVGVDVYVACTMPRAVVDYEDARVAAAVRSGDPHVRDGATSDSIANLMQIPGLCCLAMYATWVGYGNVVCPAQQGTALFVWSRYAGARVHTHTHTNTPLRAQTSSHA